MNIRQVKEFYKDKENTPCPLTDKLISSGYKQTSGGYIKIAKEKSIKNPTQYWHLMNYCNMVDGNKKVFKIHRLWRADLLDGRGLERRPKTRARIPSKRNPRR